MAEVEAAPEEVSPLAVFLASDDAVAITGQGYAVDGGAFKELARRLEEGWREYVGPDRFEEDQEKFTPPAWLANLPRMPERDSYGRLPNLG